MRCNRVRPGGSQLVAGGNDELWSEDDDSDPNPRKMRHLEGRRSKGEERWKEEEEHPGWEYELEWRWGYVSRKILPHSHRTVPHFFSSEGEKGEKSRQVRTRLHTGTTQVRRQSGVWCVRITQERKKGWAWAGSYGARASDFVDRQGAESRDDR